MGSSLALLLAATAAVVAALAVARVTRRRRAGLAVRAFGPAGLVDAGAAPVALEPGPRPTLSGAPLVNVAAVVSEALDGAQVPPGVAVVRARPRHVAFAEVDAAALRDGLRALVRAAAEAMPAGGELRVALSRQAGQLVVEVADSGAPLAESDALERARAVLARCGARLARAAVPGRGNRSRVLLAPPSPPPLRARSV